MPNDLIKSFHRAFEGELTIYSFGKDLKPPRPVPARGVFWVVSIEVVVFVITHVAGIRPPVLSTDWTILYVVVPFGVAWLLTVGKVEGRRIHTAARAWTHHAIRGRESVGGHRRLGKSAEFRKGRIQFATAHVEPERSRARYVVLLLPLIVVGVIFVLVFSGGKSHAARMAAARPATWHLHWPAFTMPVVTVKEPPPAAPPPAKHAHARPKPRPAHPKPAHPKPAPPPPTHSGPIASMPDPAPTHVQAAPHPLMPSAAPPRPRLLPVPAVPRAAVAHPIRATSGPSCYPGQLGC